MGYISGTSNTSSSDGRVSSAPSSTPPVTLTSPNKRRSDRVTPANRRLEKAPTLAEVERAAEGLINWKAPGHDSLPAELLKMDDDDPVVLECPRAVLVNVWNGGEILHEWKDANHQGPVKEG